MKKQILTFVAFMSISIFASSQNLNSTKVTGEKPVVVAEQLSFSSQEEKNLEIARVEKIIALRLSQGHSKEELVNHYSQLDRIKNALIVDSAPKK